MYSKPDTWLGTCNSNNRSYLRTAATLIGLHFLIPRCDANFWLGGYEEGRLILGAFAKLWKATISFVASVHLSARNNSALTGRIFMKFDIWVFFRKSLDEIQVSLKSDKLNGTLHEVLYTLLVVPRFILHKTRNVSNKRFTGIQNTHFMFNNIFTKIVSFMR